MARGGVALIGIISPRYGSFILPACKAAATSPCTYQTAQFFRCVHILCRRDPRKSAKKW